MDKLIRMSVDDDNPEWTQADFARAVPFSEMFREQSKSRKNQGGRRRLERPKIHVGFRLAADVVEGIRRPAGLQRTRREGAARCPGPREAVKAGTLGLARG